MPIAAAASNALKSQKAKANQQETKTKAGADPELLNFLSDQNPSKLGPKTNRLHFNRTKFQGLFGIIFLSGFYFDTISYLVHIREHSASRELGQRVQSGESKKERSRSSDEEPWPRNSIDPQSLYRRHNKIYLHIFYLHAPKSKSKCSTFLCSEEFLL